MATVMNLTQQLKQVPKSSRPMLFLLTAGVALLFFLVGFVPMWAKAEREQREVANLERKAVLLKLENTLGAATIEARGGRYESARAQASQFFTDLRLQLDQGKTSALPSEERQAASALLTGRDELITLLARGDPAGADRLENLYVAYQGIMEPEGGNALGQALEARPDGGAPVGGSP